MLVDGDKNRQAILINPLTEVVGGGQDVHNVTMVALAVELVAFDPPFGGFKGHQHRFVELAVLVALNRLNAPFGVLVLVVATGITVRNHQRLLSRLAYSLAVS